MERSIKVVRKPIARKVLIRRFALLLLIVLVGIILLVRDINIRPSIQPERQEDFINSIVPEEATDVRFTSYSAFQSVRSRLRFTIPSSALSEFVESFCPSIELIEGGYISVYNEENIEWWRPEDAQIYSIGSCIENNIEIYRVLIDKTDPQAFLVYVRIS